MEPNKRDARYFCLPGKGHDARQALVASGDHTGSVGELHAVKLAHVTKRLSLG